jgi:hypothetical protein
MVEASLFDLEEALAVFDGLAVFDEDSSIVPFASAWISFMIFMASMMQTTRGLGDLGADIGEGLTLGRGGPVKRADHGRLDVADADFVPRNGRVSIS